MVRVMLAPREQPDSSWDASVEVIQGSLTDEQTIFRAVSGAHVIIHLASAQWWGRTQDLQAVDLDGTRAVVAAARAARVGRIILVSQLGATSSSAFPLLRVKGLVEDAVRTSGLAYTILRPGILFGEDDSFINHIAMQMAVTPGLFLMPGRGETALHPLYVEDLVKAVCCTLDGMQTVDEVIEFGGAEYISLEDLLFTVMRVTGIYRTIIGVPPYMLRWINSVYERILPRTLITGQWFDILAANRTARLGNTYQYFGFQPRRIEDTLLTYMRGRRFFAAGLRYSFRRRPRRR